MPVLSNAAFFISLFYQIWTTRGNFQAIHLKIPVIPTKVGIQTFAFVLDFRLRGNDIFMVLHKPRAHERSPYDPLLLSMMKIVMINFQGRKQ